MTPLLLPRSLLPAPQPKDQNARSGTAGKILPRRYHTKLPFYSGISKRLFDFDVIMPMSYLPVPYTCSA
jgi:hypothetical protein